MNENFNLSNRDQLDELMTLLREAVEVSEHVITIEKRKKKRSLQQNKSIFVYYRIIAEKLNDAGYTLRSLFTKLEEKKGFEISISDEDVRKVAEKVSLDMFGKPVKKLTTVEIQELHKTIDKGFALSMGVSHDFPTKDPPVY